MAKKLRPWLERFLQHLKNKKEGDIVTAVDLMAATEWSPATVSAHVKKNALAPFLTPINSLRPIEDTKFRVRRDGALISKDDVDNAFTQIRPAALTLSAGLRFKAKDADYDRYVLGDLGIVRWSDMNPAFTSAGTITRASVQLGSWYYMAHEQRVAPHEATAASDIYALGISWYEMLTGNTPDPAVVAAKAFGDPSSDFVTNRLIRQMLEFDQSKRPTAADILQAMSPK